MWKAFSRSVCEVVERRVGFTAFRSDVSNSQKRPDPVKQSRVSCHGQISNIIPQLKTYCPLKHLRASKHAENSHEHSEEKRQRHQNHAGWREPPFTACLGAVAMGWSTALVLGWYLSQPLGRRIFGDAYLKERRLRSPDYLVIRRIVNAQSPIQPEGIRPLSYTSYEEQANSGTSLNSSLTSSSNAGDDLFALQRGPFTPEEALNEVSRVFEAASRALSGNVENKLGMLCMTKGQHSEAIKHFRRASHHENAVAAYNLGQCYELGLGTSRNLKKAAKWYKLGSDRGHPTAMFNLAVFLANGWGGLCEDQMRARELLILASSMGLKEAQEALSYIDKERYASSNSQLEREDHQRPKDSTHEFLEMIGVTLPEKIERPSSNKFKSTQTYLSHLDWLDLSSSSLSPAISEDMSTDESHLYSGLCLECDVNPSSSFKVKPVRNGSGDSGYYTGCNSGGAESIDEATTCLFLQETCK